MFKLPSQMLQLERIWNKSSFTGLPYTSLSQ